MFVPGRVVPARRRRAGPRPDRVRVRAQRRDRDPHHAARAAAHRVVRVAAGRPGQQRAGGAHPRQGAARTARDDGLAPGQARPRASTPRPVPTTRRCPPWRPGCWSAPAGSPTCTWSTPTCRPRSPPTRGCPRSSAPELVASAEELIVMFDGRAERDDRALRDERATARRGRRVDRVAGREHADGCRAAPPRPADRAAQGLVGWAGQTGWTSSDVAALAARDRRVGRGRLAGRLEVGAQLTRQREHEVLGRGAHLLDVTEAVLGQQRRGRRGPGSRAPRHPRSRRRW